jgi:hypothetical protein
MDYQELKMTLDHSDDITAEQAINILMADLRARGEKFEDPSDPMTDQQFIRLLARTYDHGLPDTIPPDINEEPRVA